MAIPKYVSAEEYSRQSGMRSRRGKKTMQDRKYSTCNDRKRILQNRSVWQ